MFPEVEAPLERARATSIQDRAAPEDEREGSRISLLPYIMNQSEIIPPWWSPQRDIALRAFWRGSDHVSSAVFAMQTRLASMEWHIIPLDTSIRDHVAEASEYENLLRIVPEFGEGWEQLIFKVAEDYFGTDNGAFIEVLGDGKPNGPIKGMPYGLAHLDSVQCTRTNNPEYPVVYTDPASGERYRLHYTRVIMMSQQPSAEAQMYGVGFCAVSRVINTAQHLSDTLRYMQEKLGSRPQRGMMITGGGLDPDDIMSAMQQVRNAQDNAGFRRYSNIAVVGNASIPDARAELINLASLPDGFDWRTSTEIGMGIIAMGFGVDARELFPALSVGSTRGESLVQHIKQRGRSFGLFLRLIENKIATYFLPPYLRLVFDNFDDAQDKQAAEIRNTMNAAREKSLALGLTDIRTEREQMRNSGEITSAQFIDLELRDGRMEDGSSVLQLFVSDDPYIMSLLDFGVDNPLDVEANDAYGILQEIRLHKIYLYALSGTANRSKHMAIKQCIAALSALEKIYEQVIEDALTSGQAMQAVDGIDTGIDTGELPVEQEEQPSEEDEVGEALDVDADDLSATTSDSVLSGDAETTRTQKSVKLPDWLAEIPARAVKALVPGELWEKQASANLTEDEATQIEAALQTLADAYRKPRQW